MATARIQTFCRNYNINNGYYDNITVYPRFIAERVEFFYLYKIKFCLNWKSEGVGCQKATEELKAGFKFFDYQICGKLVKVLIKYEYIPKRENSSKPSECL